jgi:hypothetical protein
LQRAAEVYRRHHADKAAGELTADK